MHAHETTIFASCRTRGIKSHRLTLEWGGGASLSLDLRKLHPVKSPRRARTRQVTTTREAARGVNKRASVFESWLRVLMYSWLVVVWLGLTSGGEFAFCNFLGGSRKECVCLIVSFYSVHIRITVLWWVYDYVYIVIRCLLMHLYYTGDFLILLRLLI